MTALPWDQRLARICVRPLARTAVTPNHITALTLAIAIGAATLFATGEAVNAHWAAGLFVLTRFLDHFDGELARLKGLSSRFGYYFDYVAGALSYAALFIGLGIGHAQGELGAWGYILGAAGAASALLSMATNLGIDRVQSEATGKEAVGYPGFAGFELEDGIYLIAPITWAGFLTPFFILAGIGATVYCAWSAGVFVRARLRAARSSP